MLKYGRPQGARTPPPGPCLGALSLPGAEVGDSSTAPEGLSHEAQQQTIANAITLSDRHADTDEA